MKSNKSGKIVALNRRKQKGFVFTLQSAIAIILLTLMLFSLPQAKNDSLKELAIIQQENDLLRVWSAKETTQNEMIQDTKLMFGEKAELFINETKILTKNEGLPFSENKSCISSSGTLVEKPFLNEKKITIRVCTS